MGFDFRMPKQTPEQKKASQELRMKGLKDEQLKEKLSAETTPAAESSAEKVEYDPQYILQVKDLKKYFPIKGGMLGKTMGHVKAIDGVTFNLKRGTTMGLVGESGCGKTTVGRTILRLHEKTDGQVLFNGQEVHDLSKNEMRSLRSKMQIIFQDPYSSLSPRLPVGEIIGEAVDEDLVDTIFKEFCMGK